MEPFIGQIQLFPYSFVPNQWSICDGSSIDIAHNQVLYALIGTTFGGDGTTTYNLPDLRGKEPAEGLTYCIAMVGMFPSRS